MRPRADHEHDAPFFYRAAVRFFLGAAAGLAVGYAVSLRSAWAVAALAGWNAGAGTLLALSAWIILGSDAACTRRRAGAEDPGRAFLWVISSLASAASLFASAGVLRQARRIAPEESGVLTALCLTSVALAWLLTHASFTLRYARLYYRARGGVGGIELPGGEPPDDLDFAYFAFTIGMCFQVSDITVSSRAIRRVVLLHALLSFAYNTAVVALALNVFFTLLA